MLYLCTMKKENENIDAEQLIKDYQDGKGIYDICEIYHIGKIKAKKILAENNVELRKKGGQSLNKKYIVTDSKQEKYLPVNDEHYIAKYKTTDYQTNDYMNAGGHLTSYIKEHEGIEIPTLYDRTEYYKETGNYWWEIYFDIVSIKNNKVKHCPFCLWTTNDLENKSGAFTKHLLNDHEMNVESYINIFPNEKYLFDYCNQTLRLQHDNNEDHFVKCQICGKKLKRIDDKHLSKHGVTLIDYKMKYGYNSTVSKTTSNMLSELVTKVNEEKVATKDDFVCKAELEIRKFLDENNIKYSFNNRKILHGQELDIYIPSYNIAIEYNGLFWHTERYGKDSKYHLNKLENCNKQGIKLIQIFEDEYTNSKELVYSKLMHLLKLDSKYRKIAGRKCTVKVISYQEAAFFLDKNHIQGSTKSSVYLGAIHYDELVGVMTFKKCDNDNNWMLDRFASLNGYICQGIGGKLFKYFIRNYNYKTIISFADRRWTLSDKNNLYCNLGFKLDKVLAPEYRYYNAKAAKYQRFHKFNFRKQILHKKYGFPLTMTELEMARGLGYERIWDCGLFRYVYYNGKTEE